MSQEPAKYAVNNVSLENIRNRHELLVIRIMQEILDDVDDFCGCSICLEDVYALTLNKVPPHYVQTGSIILRPQAPSDLELDLFVRESVETVRHHPNHPDQ